MKSMAFPGLPGTFLGSPGTCWDFLALPSLGPPWDLLGVGGGGGRGKGRQGTQQFASKQPWFCGALCASHPLSAPLEIAAIRALEFPPAMFRRYIRNTSGEHTCAFRSMNSWKKITRIFLGLS